jgi:peptidoglycan/xylan/chitin deacetylase (PgdA/CDA1 family)
MHASMQSVVRATKRLIYGVARRSGLNVILLRSGWRRRMLLVLCYHGVSLHDEHEWSALYMPPGLVRERFERIREARCTVLPLGAAVEMLYDGTLPPRAVVITFDDGSYDFYAQAHPLLHRFGWPATVYLTTYYMYFNVPVFDPMMNYLLWKGRRNLLTWPDMGVGQTVLDSAGREAAKCKIEAVCTENHLDGRQKNAVLRGLAERLDLDMDDLIARRILHLMTPDEARELLSQGVDFQLHCHRHRVYRSRERFGAELKDNQDAIERLGAPTPVHFCYPGGFHLPEFPDFLEQYGVLSATTCQPDLAEPNCSRFLLPRLVDAPSLTMDEFSGWLSGLAAWIPRRHHLGDETQLGDR